MSQDARNMTADDLSAMPDDGHRYELVQGVLRMMSPAGGRHGRIALKLARRLGDFVERHDLGTMFAAETGFLLQRDPDTVRAPDVAFVSRARLGQLADYPGYLPLVPELVAEVLSPGDRPSDVAEKTANWLAAGVTIVLIVDPAAKAICDHRPEHEVRIYTEGLLDLAAALPGYQLDVTELFA